MFILLMVCILVASLVSSMVGQGGGVLYTPVQVWLGTNVHQAATTSLFLIIVLSFSSSITFAKSGRIDWLLVLVLESVTTTSAFIGGIFSSRIKEDVLLLLLAGAITTAALPLILSMESRRGEPICRGRLTSWRRTINSEQYCINLFIAVPVSILAGLVSGMVGVGGGILKVAAMVLLLGVPVDIAVASSSIMVGITAAGGLTGHLIGRMWEWKAAMPLAVVVFVGAQIGSRISVGLNKKMLEKMLGWLLLSIAAITVVKIF
jgi:uncharacterized membrane protein YfcA